MANANIVDVPDNFIYNLPYKVIKELSRILDRDNKWEELAGKYMNFDMTTIDELRRCVCRDESPTQRLLSLWGIQNHTVGSLFVHLSRMHHYQAMVVLKPVVPPGFHPLLFEGERFQILPTGGDNGQGREAAAAAPQAQPGKSTVLNTAPVDKSMDIGSVNLNNTNGGRNTTDKVLFPKEPVPERKIENTPENAVSGESNNSDTSNGPVHQNTAPLEEDAVPQQVESMENNCPQRKMSNASDASSVAELCLTIPHIAYNELMQATDNWSKTNILGKGGFGTVFKGNWKNTLVAIKRIEQRGAESAESYQTQLQQSLRELRILNACRHDNILPVYGFSIGGGEPCLVYQYMPNGSLEDRLICRSRSSPLTWSQRYKIAVGTARGLQFLHTNEKPFIHGDIKSANILLDNNFEPRIGDFGLARDGPQTYTHVLVSRVQGTLPYLPEEFLRSKVMSTKVDTFSFGIVLFELCTGLRAYDDARPKRLLKDHVESYQEHPTDMLMDTKAGPSDVETFTLLLTLGKLCVKQRAARPKMEEVLKKLENASSLRRSPQYAIPVSTVNPSNQYPAVSPQPVWTPLNVSPEPNSHGYMGINMGYASPVYQMPRVQLSPNLHPVAHHNNPFLYPSYGQASPPMSLDNRVQQKLAAANIVVGNGVSVGSSVGHHQKLTRDLPVHWPVMPSVSVNAFHHQNFGLPYENHVATAQAPQPVIAVSPPSDHQPSSKSLNNMNISHPSVVKSESTNSSGSSSLSKSGREEIPVCAQLTREVQPSKTPPSCTDVPLVIPLITELGLTEQIITAQSKKLCM